MYIINPESIKNKIKCKKTFAQYFIEHGIPLLAREGEYYYFADTELFKEKFENAPFWIKWGIKTTP